MFQLIADLKCISRECHPLRKSFIQHHCFRALVPVMLMWTVISTYFYRKTGKVYVGAFVNALSIYRFILAEQMMASFLLGFSWASE